MRKTWAVFFDATMHFSAEDGWAVASHIALSTLTSLFPFLIFVTALAGFLGTQDLADEATRLIFAARPAVVARSIAFALVASAALLALAFLGILGPLIWAAAMRFAPGLEPLQGIVTFMRLGIATLVLAITLIIAHRWLPARRVRFVDIAPGVIATFASSIAFGE